MKTRRILAILCVLALLTTMAAGCGKAQTAQQTEAPAAEGTSETTGEGTVELATGDGYTYNASQPYLPVSWSPHTEQDSIGGDAEAMLTTPLYDFDYNDDYTAYAIVPAAAAADPVDVTEEYIGKIDGWNEDGSQTGFAFRIALNPDLCWEDGTPINADTYIYSMQQLLDPDLMNYRASDYYGSSIIIHNAKNFLYSGQTAWSEAVDSDGNPLYAYADWTQNADGQYCAADGTPLFFSLNDANTWMGGDSIASYYEQGYFADCYDGLLALADADGYVPVTDDSIALLYSFTGSADWGSESMDDLAYYVYTSVSYPETSWDDVGLKKIDDYTIDLILDKELVGFYIKYSLNVTWLVYEPLYESCKTQDATGAWSSTYGTSADTTASFGPYKLTSFVLDQKMAWTKNDTWFGYSDAYADEYGSFTRGVDGAECQQYQADNIVWTQVADASTREEMFLKGQLDVCGLTSDLLSKYSSSDALYFTEGESTYYGVLCSDYDLLLGRENVLNGGNADSAPEDCATPYKYNKTILSIKEFRQALSYAIDRTAMCAAMYPAGTAAYSLYSNNIIADPENSVPLNDFDSIRAGICELWNVTYGPDGEFATLDEAYDAITGFNLDEARKLVDQAYDTALSEGLLTEDSIVEMVYCDTEASDNATKWYNFFKSSFDTLMQGTKLEGRFQLDSDFTLGNEWFTKIQNGECDSFWGAGWTGSALDPYSLFEVYCDYGSSKDSYYQYDQWVNWCEYNLTLTEDIGDGAGAQEYTYNLYDWFQIINGMDNDGKGLPNWGFGKVDDTIRADVLAHLQTTVLENYSTIPMMNEGTVQLKGYKINYGQEDYIYGVGRGGIRYMTFNYTDSEWAAYCASQTNGILSY